MSEQISSSLTFIFKIPFPVFWLTGFSAGTIAIFGKEGFSASFTHFLIATIIGSLSFFWICIPLKKVQIKDNCLLVSNYLKTIAIPASSITKISEITWINIHPIIVHFKEKTVFGNKIMFMPKSRFTFFSSHPTAELLRRFSKL